MTTCENCHIESDKVHKRFFIGKTEKMLCDDKQACFNRSENILCRFEAPRYCDICPPQMKRICPNKKEGNESNLMPTV